MDYETNCILFRKYIKSMETWQLFKSPKPLETYPGYPAVIPQLAVTLTQFIFGWDNSRVIVRIFYLEFQLEILGQSPPS